MNEMPDLANKLSDVDEDIITYDFLARQFLKEVKDLNRRGFVKNYIAMTESTSHLGGRVLMNESMPYLVARQN